MGIEQNGPKHRPPAGLRSATKRWWLDVMSTWELEEHHSRRLTLAAQAWDRVEEARELIERDGLVTGTKRGGKRAHPAVKIELESRAQFMRLMRELDLDISEPKAAARPPMLRSIGAVIRQWSNRRPAISNACGCGFRANVHASLRRHSTLRFFPMT
jgi:Phage terminase, small subunit